jgi:hypothetical protein
MNDLTVRPQDHFAHCALRNDTPGPLANGRQLTEEEMRRMVDYAQRHGFL